MKTLLLLGALSGLLAHGAEKTEEAKTGKNGSGPAITQKRDPKQTDGNPTTQVLPSNRPVGTAPDKAVGYGTIDEDLQKRVITALSTGSIGTQGILAANQQTDLKVTVTNRHVTLRGDVISEKHKKAIGRRIAAMDGVQGVSNELFVNEKTKNRYADLTQPDGYSPGNKPTSPTAPK